MGGRGAKTGFGAATTPPPAPPPVTITAPAETPPGQSLVASAKDFNSLQQHMQSTYGFTFDKSLRKCDWDTVKEMAKNVEILAKEFPKFIPALKSINANGRIGANTFAQASIVGGVTVNTSHFRNRQYMMTEYQQNVTRGFHPQGTNGDDIVVHELGHVMEVALIYRNGRKWSEWASCAQARRVLQKAAATLGNDPFTGQPYSNNMFQLAKSVSRYATKNDSETMAECVADYFRNGSKAQPISQALWKVLKQELG